jgi:hypothetical protein
MQFEFADAVTPYQIKRHLVKAFQVPQGATRIELDFQYEPHPVEGHSNLLTLTVFDPAGFRGEGHRGEPVQHVTISRAEVTPGYLAGEIAAGQWSVVINTHLVLAPVSYRLVVNVAFEGQTASRPERQAGHTAPRGPGWYRGDFHAHTIHSDGHWDVPDLLAYARQEKLDFVTLSDHNTLSGRDEMIGSGADDLLTLAGVELTTYYGHALVLGLRRWVDWRVSPGERTMTDILTEVEEAGGCFIIAHPLALGDPYCTGCDWLYTDVMPGKARRVEIWNGAWGDSETRNEEALKLWCRWLNQGYRMVATAGSDIHDRPPHPVMYGRNVVYAQELSQSAIEEALRHGHLYLSAGPQVTLSAGENGMMGDVLTGRDIRVIARWANVPPDSELRWVVGGEVRQTQTCGGKGESSFMLDQGWGTVELRDSSNLLLAITNPIFIGTEWK